MTDGEASREPRTVALWRDHGAPPEPEPRDAGSDDVLSDLNPEQRSAVTHRGGPCLVLAGAGSGKTRVITRRVAWLIGEVGVPASAVTGVTFTNKAAAEMRQRVGRLLGRRPRGLWLMTFHALGLRLLRQNAGVEGAPPAGFAVYDRDDAQSLWGRLQRDLNIDLREYPPRRLYSRCSTAVNRLEDPASWDAPGSPWEKRLAGRVFLQYRRAKETAGVVDFDDLLLRPLELLTTTPEVRDRYAGRFRHLLVDEYQDTNRLQYRLIKALLGCGPGDEADGEPGLMVVGDEDQSIYRWRGAELANVLQFQEDFPGATVIRLERNYRSTQPILDAASSLVSHNRERLGKDLWTERTGGAKPLFLEVGSERNEARWVADTVSASLDRADDGTGGDDAEEQSPPSASEIAILYRTNAQSRSFEEEFTRRGIPYRIVGGARFFDRREVRDVLAYLRVLVRPDEAAFRRAVGVPSRGVGPATLQAVGDADVAPPGEGAARARGLPSLAAGNEANLVQRFEAIMSQEEPGAAFRDAGCPPASIDGLVSFGDLLSELRRSARSRPLPELIRETIERSGYDRWLDDEADGDERREVLEELVNAAADVEADREGAATGGLDGLATFLDDLALLTSADARVGSGGAVNLMSVHAAKGLEFHTVFLVGMEEGLFPHASAVADGQVEEERRLCYVGMTRARRRLFLSASRLRRVRGREQVQEPSRFIEEIDPRHLTVWDDPAYMEATGTDVSSGKGRASGEAGRGGPRARSSSPSSVRRLAESWNRRRGSGEEQATANGGTGPRGDGRDCADSASESSPGAGEPAPTSELQPGVRVVHPKFGRGTITARQGAGGRLKLTVRFRRAGSKRLLARYAELELAR